MDAPEFDDHNRRQLQNRDAYSGWEKNYGVVADNGPNIQGAVEFLPQESVDDSPPCMGHSVQLVVDDSVGAQRAVIDVLAIGRNIVAFFNKSKPAKNLLLQLQRDGGISNPLTVLRFVETRWDSELLMFERLVKLRPFIRDVAEHVDFRNKITVYTPYQWDLVSGMIALLCPVRVLTKFTQLQSPRPGLALFEVVRCKHEVQAVDARGLGTMKEELVTTCTERMSQYIGTRAFMLAALLDINMKGCVFNAEERRVCYDLFVATVAKHTQRSRVQHRPPWCSLHVHTFLPVAREMHFLQTLLTQEDEQKENLDIPLDDAVMEATREVHIFKSYPQDISLSTNCPE